MALFSLKVLPKSGSSSDADRPRLFTAASVALVLVAFLLQGCASIGKNPEGSEYWYADYNKYDKNYADFPTADLRIGQTSDEIIEMLGSDFNVIEATSDYRVIAYDKWISVPGPDYVGQRLLITLTNDRIEKWSIQNNTIENVPRSW